MKNERLVIKPTDEDFHFQERDKEMVEKLRATANKEANEAYRSAHMNHCFRCGTRSLVEVKHKHVKIDMCVNDGCGAVHLDPGEMEKIIEDEKGIFGTVKESIFSIFK